MIWFGGIFRVFILVSGVKICLGEFVRLMVLSWCVCIWRWCVVSLSISLC